MKPLIEINVECTEDTSEYYYSQNQGRDAAKPL